MHSPTDTRRAEEASVEARKCVGAQALVFFKLDKERLPRDTRERDVWDVSHGLKLQHEMPLEIQLGGSPNNRIYDQIFPLIMGRF